MVCLRRWREVVLRPQRAIPVPLNGKNAGFHTSKPEQAAPGVVWVSASDHYFMASQREVLSKLSNQHGRRVSLGLHDLGRDHDSHFTPLAAHQYDQDLLSADFFMGDPHYVAKEPFELRNHNVDAEFARAIAG